MRLLTEAIENDRHASPANPLGEIFQEFFILVPVASGQATPYPVRESDRLQFRKLCDLIKRLAESFNARSCGIPPRRWFPWFELAVNVDDTPLVAPRIAVNRDRTEKRSVVPALGTI